MHAEKELEKLKKEEEEKKQKIETQEEEQKKETEKKDTKKTSTGKKTSAKEATGVEDLFLKIGNKFVNPSGTGAAGGSTSKGDKIKLGKGGDKPGKKGCC